MSTNGQDGKRVDELNIAEWEQSLRDARARYEAEARELNKLLESAHVELNRIRTEEELIAQVSRAYAARLHSSAGRPSLPGNNLREVIIINFADAGGVIQGREVCEQLTKSRYYSSRDSAYGAVYTALGKPPFVKVTKGVYRIPHEHQDWLRLRARVVDANGHQIRFEMVKEAGITPPPIADVKPGIAKKVKDISLVHPEWNRQQVVDSLLSEGWDFGGKKPMSSVNISFSRLAQKRFSPKVLAK